MVSKLIWPEKLGLLSNIRGHSNNGYLPTVIYTKQDSPAPLTVIDFYVFNCLALFPLVINVLNEQSHHRPLVQKQFGIIITSRWFVCVFIN